MSDNGSTVTKSRGAKGSIILILWDEYSVQYYFFWNDTSRFSLILKVGIISAPVVAVVVVAVVVVVVAGGDYLDAGDGSSGRRRWRLSRHLS